MNRILKRAGNLLFRLVFGVTLYLFLLLWIGWAAVYERRKK